MVLLLYIQAMKQLKVPFKPNLGYHQAIGEIATLLDHQEKHALEFVPWPVYPYKPRVQFSIAHSNDGIFLKYFVNEKYIRAAAGSINGAVWEDACVEFFVSFDETGYYNLEFNCIGTALAGFGKIKGSRVRLSEEIIRKIKYGSMISNGETGHIHWELTVAIPLEVFAHHDFSSLKGRMARANFYKCGDALPDPHFISWANIEAPKPDFHLAPFFGAIEFEGD